MKLTSPFYMGIISTREPNTCFSNLGRIDKQTEKQIQIQQSDILGSWQEPITGIYEKYQVSIDTKKYPGQARATDLLCVTVLTVASPGH